MHVRAAAVALLVLSTVGATVAVGSHGEATATGAIECEFPVTETDATGTAVTVEREPERIVTLSPSAAQTMWEIGGREKVVGRTRYASYLEGAASREDVSAGSGEAFVNAEAVVDLEPDLVLAPNVVPNETVRRLRDAGLTVFKFDYARSIADVEAKTRLTGRLAGECDGAEATVAWMEERLATVDAAVEGRDRPRVLYVFGEYTAGTGTYVHRIVERAGGRNVAAAANVSGYAPINQEVVVERDPEWIVVDDGAPTVPATAAYNGTTAVQRGQVVVLPAEHLSQPAPRLVHAVVTLAQALHPEAYAAANATGASPNPAGSASPTATDATDGADATTATDGQPGFDALAALAGALAAGLLGRHR